MKKKVFESLRKGKSREIKDPPYDHLQKAANYSTIIGSFLTIIIGIFTFWLMIKYGENKDMINRLITVAEKLEIQNQKAQEQINLLRTQVEIDKKTELLLNTQLSIAEKQLRRELLRDSLEKWANVIKFTENCDGLGCPCCLLKGDTGQIKSLNDNIKIKILQDYCMNLSAGLLNPILMEDSLSFQEWNKCALQAGGILSTYLQESETSLFSLDMEPDELEKYKQDCFNDLLHNCCALTILVFRRILCKYRYNASC